MKTGRDQYRLWACRIVVTAVLTLSLVGIYVAKEAYAAEQPKWSGVDEAVIEKISQEHGRPAKPALIDKEDGDLLLFCFLVAGVVGGFTAGYYWRILFSERAAQTEQG
jgi:hypothetical protein